MKILNENAVRGRNVVVQKYFFQIKVTYWHLLST